MLRGKYALLIPSEISERGVRKLVEELEGDRVTVIDKDDNLVLVKWDESSRIAVAKGPSIQAFYVDRVSPAAIRKLPERVARVALLWNWSISNRGKRTTDGTIKRLMSGLQLEVRAGQVYDSLTRRNLGKVESGEEEERQGNWCLRQNNGWERVPGWFGYWEKLWCRSRTYVHYPACSGDRLVMDYLLAEVDGPQHYAYQSRSGASIAYTYDWDYIWVGESHCGTAFSYARRGGSTASLTRRIC
jgi:hypothetical protein